METGDSGLLAGAEIHGFLTAADLDVEKLMEDASTRWFRPNEVYAILSNYTLLRKQPQPIDKPTSGRLLLFDRKMLRNFRKDGHNWKKKKDGKTVQEAHEKLKIGNVERIHVYYARSEDDHNFYRRCYWLLDKDLEHIVLVHYRQTSEDNVFQQVPSPKECTEALSLRSSMPDGSSVKPVNSGSGSEQSDLSVLAGASDEIDSGKYDASSTGVYVPFTAGSGMPLLDSYTKLQNHELRFHEINTLEWEELVGSSAPNFSHPMSQNPSNISSGNGLYGVDQLKDLDITSASFTSGYPDSQVESFGLDVICSEDTNTCKDGALITQANFGSWNCIDDNSLCFSEKLEPQTPKSTDDRTKPIATSFGEHIFTITQVSPCWSYCTEETKVLVVGNFCASREHLMSSSIYCVIGELCTKAEMVHPGVYSCIASPQPPGVMNFFLTMDGHTPISQVLSFDCRCLPNNFYGLVTSSKDDYDETKCKDYELQKRLAYLLFATSNNIALLSCRIPPKSLNEVKKFLLQTSPLIEKDWKNFLNLSIPNETSSSFKEDFLELALKSKFNEWLLVRIAEGRKGNARDSHGQGVIHLCAILDYTWAIRPYALSGLSMDFRDIHGWTPLHWAAHYGREKMVAALLSAGANPSLVTDPSKESHGGSTAADLASKQGYEGLAAYLAEKGLIAHYQAMTLSGNTSPHGKPLSPAASTSENVSTENLSEQELCLKESLAAYRNAANAADHIQSAMRIRALRLQTKAVQLAKPEMEAAQIVAALKIQHAFRRYNRRKMMKAAARIQSHFRTWKIRRNFIDMRKKTIKIQSAFRGHQVRNQYRKLIWSVGVLEKAILRWRLKRKGLRGIQVETTEAMRVDTTPESTGEEDFFRISREHAEERVRRSVVRVQAMFRSYQAQQEYRRMKVACEQAKLEFCDLSQQQQ